MKKYRILLTGVLVVFTGLMIYFLIPKSQPQLIVKNNQIYLETGKKYDSFRYNDSNLTLYKSATREVKIHFDIMHVDKLYDSDLVINNHRYALNTQNNSNLEFKSNQITIPGANIKEGKLELSFRSGTFVNQARDSFFLRNVFIEIGNEEIWSIEFSKTHYLNETLHLGSENLKTDYRYNYQEEIKFTFDIPEKFLDCKAYLLNDISEKYCFEIDGKSFEFINPYYIDFDLNISDQETLSDSRELLISNQRNVDLLKVYLDGLKVYTDISFTKDSWADGKHQLEVIASNKNFEVIKKIDFFLDNSVKSVSNPKYEIYHQGANEALEKDIINLGKKIEDNGEEILIPFSNIPIVNFKLEKNAITNFIVEAQSILNRTLFMDIFDHQAQEWVTVSTNKNQTASVKLGFDYQNQSQFILENFIYLRVGSVLINEEIEIHESIYQVTDIQYITQKLAKATGVMQIEAQKAFETLSEALIADYESGKMQYMLLTGDIVQTKSNRDAEWKAVMEHFFEPLFSKNVPFGVSSGNHDVGGLSENSADGGNALDDELYYDYFSKYLGENSFKGKAYYGESFRDNRSHYDLITLNGCEFLFLYLGWGSSIKGIHVSELDIAFARQVLEKYPDKNVVLATHDYMGNKTKRTTTGEYVYQKLVKSYSNIVMVLSGHVNGSSARVDLIDDDNDQLYDRRVLQVLTDFQEEEDLYGAAYIRKIGLDFTNSQMIFDIFSPFYQENDIFVKDNQDLVAQFKFFKYAFNLNNEKYGLIVKNIGA